MGYNYTVTPGISQTGLAAEVVDILTAAGLVTSDLPRPFEPADVRVYPAAPITNSVYVDAEHLDGDSASQDIALSAAANALLDAGWYVRPVALGLSFRTGRIPTAPPAES